MVKDQKFFICKHCGNIVGMIESSGAPLVCCGDQMTELVANTTEAAVEKHIPVVTVKDGRVTVTIGSVAHPMLEEHHISWVYLRTDKGGQRKSLEVGAKPEVVFAVTEDETPLEAYAYCNLHGLWKKEI